MYTRFFDMSSGGREKTPYTVIYVAGDRETAEERFRCEFEMDPNNTTCDCCGPDFSIDTYDTLEEAREIDDRYGHSSYVVED